ncbi:HAD-IIA family hydrolase [Pelistega ratti]|uniref:HAD-IIA family hydrolase n=1 Tax=Pelistega ratti TaxID=2652177 RepID=UPI001359B522|nr:HAD-IIA family hydrolase [Pelistega ratti]
MQHTLTADNLLSTYKAITNIFSSQTIFPSHYQQHQHLGDIAHLYKAFFFDAFGVLNIGEKAIPLAVERIQDLRQKGKKLFIVSNAASVTKDQLYKKYTTLGFDFTPEEIISSRDALAVYLRQHPVEYFGVIAPQQTNLSDLQGSFINLQENTDSIDQLNGFLLLSSQDWTATQQQQLIQSLQKKKRPILLANPDLVAPREHNFSIEPGLLAYDIWKKTGIKALPFGKPYANIFDIAKAKLPKDIHLQQVLMVGDTLFTDVLGGCMAGVNTAMVTDNGFASMIDWKSTIQETKICPNHIIHFI